jgi:hypothetical protein
MSSPDEYVFAGHVSHAMSVVDDKAASEAAVAPLPDAHVVHAMQGVEESPSSSYWPPDGWASPHAAHCVAADATGVLLASCASLPASQSAHAVVDVAEN